MTENFFEKAWEEFGDIERQLFKVFKLALYTVFCVIAVLVLAYFIIAQLPPAWQEIIGKKAESLVAYLNSINTEENFRVIDAWFILFARVLISVVLGIYIMIFYLFVVLSTHRVFFQTIQSASGTDSRKKIFIPELIVCGLFAYFTITYEPVSRFIEKFVHLIYFVKQ